MKRKVIPKLGRKKYYRYQFDFKKRWLASLGKHNLNQHLLSSKHMVSDGIGVNNHLLTTGLIYYVVLNTAIPYILINNTRFGLTLGGDLGLDLDGDTIIVIESEGTLYAAGNPWVNMTAPMVTIKVGINVPIVQTSKSEGD